MAARKRTRSLPYLLLALAVIAGIAWKAFGPALADDPDARWRPQYAGTAPDPALVTAHQGFGFDLLKTLSTTPGENVFLSPYSIATALTMTYNGAAGGTKDAMAQTLRLGGLPLETVNRSSAALKARLEAHDGKARLVTANSLWAQEGFPFEPDFIQRNTEFFRAGLETLDIQGNPGGATQRINRWTEKRTQGRIKGILSRPLTADTVLVLVNAAHFKAPWVSPFEVDATKDLPFTRHDGTTGTVPMMHRTDQIPYHRADGFEAVVLDYRDSPIRMVLLKPESADGLPALIRRLDAPFWAALREGLGSQGGMSPSFTLGLPRFRIEYAAELKDPLVALGMGPAFDEVADFTAMAPVGLFLTRVSHKAFLDVNEERTEAAAATGGGVATAIAMPAEGLVVFDHPFLCALEDRETGEIVFLGAVYDPEPMA